MLKKNIKLLIVIFIILLFVSLLYINNNKNTNEISTTSIKFENFSSNLLLNENTLISLEGQDQIDFLNMFEGDFKEYILKKIQNNKLELFYFDYIEQYIENNNDTDFKEIFNKYKESKTISISNINFSNIEKEVTMSDDIYYTMKMEINIKNYPIQETLNIQNIELGNDTFSFDYENFLEYYNLINNKSFIRNILDDFGNNTIYYTFLRSKDEKILEKVKMEINKGNIIGI